MTFSSKFTKRLNSSREFSCLLVSVMQSQTVTKRTVLDVFRHTFWTTCSKDSKLSHFKRVVHGILFFKLHFRALLSSCSSPEAGKKTAWNKAVSTQSYSPTPPTPCHYFISVSAMNYINFSLGSSGFSSPRPRPVGEMMKETRARREKIGNKSFDVVFMKM